LNFLQDIILKTCEWKGQPVPESSSNIPFSKLELESEHVNSIPSKPILQYKVHEEVMDGRFDLSTFFFFGLPDDVDL